MIFPQRTAFQSPGEFTGEGTNLKRKKMGIKREIIVRHGVMRKLERDCRCSSISVRGALKGVVNSQLADVIRKRAIEIYGGVYESSNNKK